MTSIGTTVHTPRLAIASGQADKPQGPSAWPIRLGNESNAVAWGQTVGLGVGLLGFTAATINLLVRERGQPGNLSIMLPITVGATLAGSLCTGMLGGLVGRGIDGVGAFYAQN